VWWYMATGVAMALLILVRLIPAIRAPAWGQPQVTVDAEGLAVTDVAGVTRTVAWSEAGKL